MRLVFALSLLPALLSAQRQGIILPNGSIQNPVTGGILGGIPGGVGTRPKPVASDCTLDGSVVNKVTGEPVPRAKVVLMGQGGQAMGSADSAGRWSFSNVSCGQIQVVVTRPGFLQGMSGAPQLGAVFRPVILADGASVHDMKIQLVPQAVVVGRVRDDQGDPVPNALVSALASRVFQGRRTLQPVGNTQTNDLGEFRLANMQGGRYVVCASGGNQMGALQPTDGSISGESCYPGPIEGGAASAMQLASGSDVRVDFTLPRVPAVHVRGVVLGLPKNQGVGVTLAKRGLMANGPMGGRSTASVQPDGRFVLNGVTAGSYTLITDYFEAGKRLTARVPVEVGGSDLDDVTVRLEPGFTVTGTVRYESRSGAAPGAPLNQQFNLNLHTSDGLFGGGGVQWNKDRTAFSVPDLPSGVYRLDGFAQGRYYLKSATLNGRDLSREDVPIGQAGGPIDVVLSDESGGIDGQVLDGGDQPVSSWVMVLAEGRQPRNLMTDASGNFKVSGLAPGDYQLYAWDDAQQVEYATPEWMRRYSAVRVSVQADQTAQAKLKLMTVGAQ
ncbi:MAG: carboxypeptidase-like regulatory domain-containing protein [Acidobacteriota bacterium]|nr:carboxypeptidase-like regulatory domain-containing protein [Acidobacteriota bacterium]